MQPFEVEIAVPAPDGTFLLRYEGQIQWTGTPQWPVTVTLGPLGAPFATLVVSESPFVLQARVPPGQWRLYSETSSASWWGAYGPALRVDPGGGAECLMNCDGIVHRRKLQLVELPWETPLKAPPELRWSAFPGASRYRLRWFEKRGDEVVKTVQNIEVKGTSWQFPEPLVEARVYEWDVEALSADGNVIAHNTSYFQTPGVVPVVRTSWLGVQLTPSMTGTMHIDRVIPGSPAEQAGFRAGDLMLTFGGEPMDDPTDLYRLVGQTAPGTPVEVRVRTPSGEERTLRPVIARKP